MSSSACQLLDGYLGHWLSDAEERNFLNHLSTCSECQQIVQDQERLNRAFTRATEALNPLPPGLVSRINLGLVQARRRLVRRTALVAAALVLAALAGWALMDKKPAASSQAPMVDASPQPAPAPSSLVRVNFPPSARVIALPRESTHPNVTVFWVYPMIETATPLVHADAPQSP